VLNDILKEEILANLEDLKVSIEQLEVIFGLFWGEAALGITAKVKINNKIKHFVNLILISLDNRQVVLD
jgi:hypothetical protein